MALVFDAAILSRKADIPEQFVWPADEAIAVPVVDLAGILDGDGLRDLAAACERHGFFQVVNHGVKPALLAEAYRCCDAFYARPIHEKQRAQRRPGENHGYAGSFVGRFGSRLPWKETMSFNCSAAPENARMVVDYFVAVLGEEYRHTGEVYQEYCNEMTRLAMDVTDVLATCLGLGRGVLRGFFEGGDSVMRLNHYPPCPQPQLTLGTGPHHDPTSLTLLHQDEVGGLQVFTGGAWRAVRPRSDAFVVNIGDTFSALTNGRHTSCLHRAVVNGRAARRSLTFFLNPLLDRPVAPPAQLLALDGRPRVYPDFTWREFLEFTQKQYRSDSRTLDAFVAWIEQGRGRGGHGSRPEEESGDL
uniref:Uncharacterized protein n=1 Tax=Avena sativa TaxID=4498 RepID=A0ACD5UNE2_AVESA